MVNAVIWDWNGTLLNDVDENLKIVNQLLFQRNKSEISFSIYKQLFRMPIKDFYKDVGFEFKEESFDDVAKKYNQLYKKRFHTFTLNDGVLGSLEYINQKGIKQYILSASHQDDLIKQVNSFHIDKYFSSIIGNDDYAVVSKIEKARNFAKILDTENILYIGDLYHDYEVSQVFHATCLLFIHGHQEIKESEEYSRISHISEVLDYLE